MSEEINLTIDNLYNICRLVCVFTERKIHLSLSEMIAALQTLGYDYREGEKGFHIWLNL